MARTFTPPADRAPRRPATMPASSSPWSDRPRRHAPVRGAPVLALLLAAVAAWPGAARGQMLKDGALDALFAAGRFDELERQARQRLGAGRDDPQAVLAWALVALQSGDVPRLRPALEAADACVARQPQNAACQYAAGALLGVHSGSEGLLKLAASAGRVRDSLAAALSAEPGWYAARSALVEYHVLVPVIAGGSMARARELAQAAARPEQARALGARIALGDKRPEEALQTLAAIDAATLATDSALAADVRQWARAAAFTLVNNGQAERARGWFERLVRERPDDPVGPFGLGRVAAEGGAHERAVALFQQAARLPQADPLPIDYRLGLSQLALGQTDAARASLKRFVAAGRGSSRTLDDARRRLEQLGS